MDSYRAYGLTLQSELELPELIAVDTAPDVTVRFGRVERLPAEADSQWHSFWVTPEESCLYYQDIGAFLMCQGHEITIDPAPNVEERVLRLALLGPALSIILHQRSA